MAIDWGVINRDPIGSIIAKAQARNQANQQMQGEAQRQVGEDQRQRLAENADQEKTAQWGADNMRSPQFDENNVFQGYSPNVSPDVQSFAQKMQERQEGGGLNPIYQQNTTPQIQQPTTPSGRPGGYDPGGGPPQPPSTPAQRIQAAGSPAPDDGIKPILTHPDALKESAKARAELEGAQAGAPGSVLGTAPSASPGGGGTAYQNQPPQQHDVADVTAVPAPAPPPMDPYLAKRLVDFGTTQTHYNMDPPVNLSTLPLSLRKKIGVNVDDKGNDVGGSDIWVPTSIAGKMISGEYGKLDAQIKAGASIPNSNAAAYVTRVRNGEDPGAVMQDMAKNGDLTGGNYKAIDKAASLHQADVRIGLSGDRLLWKKSQDMQKDLDPSRSSNTNMNRAAKVVDSADRLDGLFQQFPDYNVPKAQTEELATAVAGMISGGSPQSQQQINNIVPHSLQGDASGIASWFTGDPMGQEQQDFVHLLHDTEVRERAINQGIITRYQVSKLGAYHDVATQYPGIYGNITKAMGIDPSIDPNLNGGGSAPATQRPRGGAGHTPPQSGSQNQPSPSLDYEGERQKYLAALDDPKRVDPAKRTQAYGAFDKALREKYNGKGIRGF